MKIRKNAQTPKRQWGTERSTRPLSIVHAKPSMRAITLSRLAIVITICFWILYFISTIIRQFYEGPKSFEFQLQSTGYLLVMTSLIFSALMYLVSRQGALQRFSKHVRTPRALLDRHFSEQQLSVTVLIPSYSEEPEVIFKTMFSAAIQEYPALSIVLLMDDKPFSTDPEITARLEETRGLAKRIENMLEKPAKRFASLQGEISRVTAKNLSVAQQKKIKNEYEWAAKWLNDEAGSMAINDHVDEFFRDQVLKALADELTLTSQALAVSLEQKKTITSSRAKELTNRLAWIFAAKLDVFERKRYASLSHEANKAMNINSYIGLMGGAYKKVDTPDGTILAATALPAKDDLVIPDSDYILTLDADSVLLRDYCLRLVHFTQEPGNERIAVVQTPYSSFRGAHTRIERLAGATTDIQHILHQGKTYYDATFWVGANAIIRKQALEDIVEKEWVGGFEIKRYVQDRTVIEDTESSIDLTLHGWKLVNYPERLSYSATPPDFGSLVVQRRRWANGGLLILPKLIKHHGERKRLRQPVSYIELLLRINYMASIAWGSFGLIFLLAFPYDSRLLSPLVLLAALPYFMAMASDLHYCGYKRSDIFRIYGFNLILLPVNLAGVLKSIQQAITGKKIPFARTPKVKDRTLSQASFILSPMAIIAFSVITCIRDINAENWSNAAFAAFNTIVAVWAFIAYIGLGNTLVDLWHSLVNWLYVDVNPKTAQQTETPLALNWEAVLYHGDTKERLPLGVDGLTEVAS